MLMILQITFIFILILFIDSVNRVYSVQMELAKTKQSNKYVHEYQRWDIIANIRSSSAMLEGSGRMEVQARKFYSQRNMYLCGFTLFLSLILNRTYVMILDTLRLEEKVKRYEGDPKTKSKESERLDQVGGPGEIGRLKNQLAQKDRDIETLKKQSEGLSREYNNLGDQVGNRDSTPKKDR